MQLTIDFEARSRVEIKDRGAYVYAADPSTEAMCMGIAVDDEPVRLWIADHFLGLVDQAQLKYPIIRPLEVLRLAFKADKVVAHNSMFEYLLWNWCLKWPHLPLEKLHCTAAQSRYHALPSSLEGAGAALGLPIQKDKIGHAAMLRTCKPVKKTGEWNEDPQDLLDNFNYCGMDIETTRLLHKTLAPLPAIERKIWLMDQRINLRGVPVDLPGVQAWVSLVQKREQGLIERFKGVVNGAVSGPRSYVKIKEWLNSRGVPCTSVDKEHTLKILARDNVPEDIREALTIKSEISKSSTSKLKAMINRSHQGRIYGMFYYFGAATGRWTGEGVQLHNLPRDSYYPEEWEGATELAALDMPEAMKILYDDIFFAASRCVRGALCAPEGKNFVASDFSSVEARGLALLANEAAILKAFDEGMDVYKIAAASTFDVPYDEVTKAQRQVGKVQDLALGYNGGIGALVTMGTGYGIDLETLPPLILPSATHEELGGTYGAKALATMYKKQNPEIKISFNAAVACDILKRRWRDVHPATCDFWKDLNAAAVGAIANPGDVFEVGDLKYVVHNDFLKCLLPSGRLLQYYQPQMRINPTPWDESHSAVTYMSLKVANGRTTRAWVRTPTYGGKLAENVVQAYCRDLLAWAMLRLEKAGFKLVMHVHDEAVAESPTDRQAEFDRIMEIVPAWAAGMPIKSSGWIGRRYRK